MGLNYLNTLEGDTVTVYHGTGAQNYQGILNNGITSSGGDSYQVNGAMNQPGIWVTLKRDIANGYAKQSAEGFMKDNPDSEFAGWAVVFEFIVNKNLLSDEGSGVKQNFQVTESISSTIIQSGHAHIFNIINGKTYQSF
jgi:hypothetical protein